MKKAISLLMCIVIMLGLAAPSFAANPDDVPALNAKFKDGCGPEVDGLSVDYVYYEPEGEHDEALPLVIYFHGAGGGVKPRAQIKDNHFSLWASEEIQQRFTGGGAYLFVPRSHEEKGEFWEDKYIPGVKAAIDEFIAQREGKIDLSRIYVGGYSMGGKMTLKTASSYPDMFAAAFPLCPAYIPSAEQIEALSDMPVWLIVSRFDILAGYYTFSKDIWDTLCKSTNVPGDCRLTLFGTVKKPDGKRPLSNHFVWLALANDLFTYDEGKYPNAVTTDALGNEIELTSPDGVISWLCGYTSDFSGEELTPSDALKNNPDKGFVIFLNMLKAAVLITYDAVKTFFDGLPERIAR